MLKKVMVVFLSLFAVIFMSSPVIADVNLNINGKIFQPNSSPQLEKGITTVPLSVIAKTLGADISINEGKTIIIRENDNTLQMTVGSLNANYNGKDIFMPKVPEKVNEEIMLPIRFVLEIFGVEIGWKVPDKTVTVEYQEKRNGMTVEEMLTEVSANMEEFNTYKMNMDMNMIMDISGPGEEKQKVYMSTLINAAVQNDPVLMYMEQQISACSPELNEGSESNLEELTTEMLFNEDGLYMTIPEEGWAKIEVPGMDMKDLMEQSNNQDPVSSIQEMKDFGVVMSYANNQIKDGQEYWIIHVTLGRDSFSKYFQDIMEKMPIVDPECDAAETPADIEPMMNDLINNMQVDMVYDLWVDKQNLLPQFMELGADIKINMEVAGADNEKTILDMSMLENVYYKIYDLGVPIIVPDVSEARDFSEIMQGQIQVSADTPESIE